MMKLQNLRCPNCTGKLDINIDGKEYIFCPYCGDQFYIGGEKREYTINKNISINKVSKETRHYIDEAEVIRASTADRESKNSWKWFIGLIAFFAAIAAFCFFMAGTEDRAAAKAEKEGKISAGKYEDYEGEDYAAVVEQLKSFGFTNISCVDLDDSGVLFWRDGKVESVSIEGDTTFYSSDYFYPDVVIVITYH